MICQTVLILLHICYTIFSPSYFLIAKLENQTSSMPFINFFSILAYCTILLSALHVIIATLKTNKAKKLNQKEHINEYILENKKEFKIKILKNNKKKMYSKLNFSIDTIHDYNYCSSIINNISQPITIKKIIKYAIIQRKKF